MPEALELKIFCAAAVACALVLAITAGVTAAIAAASAAASSSLFFSSADVKSIAMPAKKTIGTSESAKTRAILPRRSCKNRLSAGLLMVHPWMQKRDVRGLKPAINVLLRH